MHSTSAVWRVLRRHSTVALASRARVPAPARHLASQQAPPVGSDAKIARVPSGLLFRDDELHRAFGQQDRTALSYADYRQRVGVAAPPPHTHAPEPDVMDLPVPPAPPVPPFGDPLSRLADSDHVRISYGLGGMGASDVGAASTVNLHGGEFGPGFELGHVSAIGGGGHGSGGGGGSGGYGHGHGHGYYGGGGQGSGHGGGLWARIRQWLSTMQGKLLVGSAATCGVYCLANLDRTAYTGRLRVMGMNRETEDQMGEQVFQALLEDERVLPPDHPYARTVIRVGERLVRAAGDVDFDWKFAVVDNPAVNAVCAPGGRVVVFSGLLKVVNSEDELAMVLAHEIGHALARHSAERMTFANIQYLLMSLVMSTIEVPRYLTELGMKYLIDLPYSRKFETEADRIGITLMARACYDPKQAPRFFETMRQTSGEHISFLATHPSHADRIEALKALIPAAEQERSAHCAQASSFMSGVLKWPWGGNVTPVPPGAAGTRPVPIEVVNTPRAA